MKIFMLCLSLSFYCVSVHAQEKVSMELVQQELTKAKSYTLAFFLKGEKVEDTSDETAQRTQMEHLQYLFTLKEQNKLLLFGPLTDHGNIRGIMIFSLTDIEQVKALLNEDPHVKAGHLAYEVHPWFGIPGQALK